MSEIMSEIFSILIKLFTICILVASVKRFT